MQSALCFTANLLLAAARLTVLLGVAPGILDKIDAIFIQLSQILQVGIFALVGERVYTLVTVVVISQEYVRAWSSRQP